MATREWWCIMEEAGRTFIILSLSKVPLLTVCYNVYYS